MSEVSVGSKSNFLLLFEAEEESLLKVVMFDRVLLVFVDSGTGIGEIERSMRCRVMVCLLRTSRRTSTWGLMIELSATG